MGALPASQLKYLHSLMHINTHTHTHTHYHPMISMTASDNSTHSVKRHYKHTFLSQRELGKTPTFSLLQQQRCWLLMAAVAMAMAAHKGIFDLKDVQGRDRVKREGQREKGWVQSFKDTQQPCGHVRV